MFEFITVRELYELYINDRNQLDGIEYVELQGWIRTNRNSGKVGFLALNDGTYFKNVQVPSTTKCVASISKGCFPSGVNFNLPVTLTALPVEI